MLENNFGVLPDEDYIADQEMVDSLKLDSSTLSPIQENLTKSLSRIIQLTINTKYSRFIPETTLARTKDIPNRIIVTDDIGFQNFFSEWEQPAGLEKISIPKRVQAIVNRLGYIIVTKPPESFWDLIDTEKQLAYIQMFGSENKAKQVATESGFNGTLMHEILHLYQAPLLPKYFTELAVRYYERDLSLSLRLNTFTDKSTNKRLTFYSELIRNFGNDVHSLFFLGDGLDFKRSKLIYDKFTEETINYLFPNGQGLYH